jgi:intergrase/recombinase
LILENKPRLKYSSLNPKLRKHELECRVKQLRKYNGTMLREHLSTEITDLLQGRINESIFPRYYYKPLLQDIQQRTTKALQQLQKELIEKVRHNQNQSSLFYA